MGVLREIAQVSKLLQIAAVSLLALAVLLPLESRTHAATRDGLVIIVGAAAGVSDISLIALRRAFRGEIAELGNGKRIVPFNHPVHSQERIAFDRKVLGLEPDDVGRFWINRRIRDEGLPPRTLPSAEVGLRVVASFPGAVTYLRASMVDRSVRVVSIDGIAPGRPGYLLPDL